MADSKVIIELQKRLAAMAADLEDQRKRIGFLGETRFMDIYVEIGSQKSNPQKTNVFAPRL